jgi:non-ribosomal peptide synthetase component F
MHPGVQVQTRPDHPAAVVAGSGKVLAYRELDARSSQLAHLFRDAGFRVGDHVEILMENQLAYSSCCGQRCGRAST